MVVHDSKTSLNQRWCQLALHIFFSVVFHRKTCCRLHSLFLILSLQKRQKHPAVSELVSQCQQRAQGEKTEMAGVKYSANRKN